MTTLSDLKSQKRWVEWRAQGGGKKPFKPGTIAPAYVGDPAGRDKRGKPLGDPETWGTFDETKSDQVGIVLGLEDKLCGVDLDGCRDPNTGEISEWARRILQLLKGTYAEISPSGTGVKVYCYGLPANFDKAVNLKIPNEMAVGGKEAGCEVYAKFRYFAVTWKKLPDHPEEITDQSVQLLKLVGWLEEVGAKKKAQDQIDNVEIALPNETPEDIQNRVDECFNDVIAKLKTETSMRNNALRDAAFYIASLVKHEYVSEEYAVEELTKAAIENGYAEKDGLSQVSATIRSSLHAGLHKSRLPAKLLSMGITLTEEGNGRRIARAQGENMRWVQEWKRWMVYDGAKWSRDGQGSERAMTIAFRAFEEIKKEGRAEKDDKKKAALLTWYMKCLGYRVATNSLTLARSMMTAPPNAFDTDDWLFNLRNGTLDLKTQILNPHNRDDFISKMVPYDYDPGARNEAWEKFVETIYPDPDLRSFVQRAFGYSLTGNISERALFIMYGDTGSGKSTMVETLYSLLGDEQYSQAMDFASLLKRDTDKVRNDIAKLAGARMAGASETTDDKKFDEVMIKRLTGDDKIAARFLYAEEFTFKPTFKIWLGTNRLPKITEAEDNAIWSRINIIPHTVMTPIEQQDLKLKDKINDNLPGVLNWALDGLKDYLENGLNRPECVRLTTEKYRNEEDSMARYVEDRLVITSNRKDKIPQRELGEDYLQWCNDSDEHPFNSFGRKFGKRYCDGTNILAKPVKIRGELVKCWIGVRFRRPDEYDVLEEEDIFEAALEQEPDIPF